MDNKNTTITVPNNTEGYRLMFRHKDIPGNSDSKSAGVSYSKSLDHIKRTHSYNGLNDGNHEWIIQVGFDGNWRTLESNGYEAH